MAVAMLIKLVYILSSLFAVIASTAGKFIEWELTNSTHISLSTCDGKIGPIRGSVPGIVHTDLMAAGLLKLNPYFRFEEENLSWITEKCWEYTLRLDLSIKDLELSSDLYIKFDGIDTVSTIYFNDVEIGSTNNAFRAYSFLVPRNIVNKVVSTNVVRIELASAREYTKSQAVSYPYVVPETQNWNVWAEPTSRNFVRKAGSDMGWDWGPAYIPSGITGKVSFFQMSKAGTGRLAGFAVQQNIADDYTSAQMTVSVHVADIPVMAAAAPAIKFAAVKGDISAPSEVTVSVKVNGASMATQTAYITHSTGSKSEQVITLAPITIADLQLWWPIGVKSGGLPTLYTVEVTYDVDQVATRNVGFRTVELIQDPVPVATTAAASAATKNAPQPQSAEVSSSGSSSATTDSKVGGLYTVQPTSFYFKINGLAVFMRGANFIPIDSFQSRVTDQDREYVLRSAAQANMNMVRVWGGGIYQPDQFYELADSLGIMIWQEVMLACALYPSSTTFLAEIDAEVRHQALRLGTHPSIVVWGGNNENEVALGWFPESLQNRDLYVSDYSKLYGATVYPALASVLGGFTSGKLTLYC